MLYFRGFRVIDEAWLAAHDRDWNRYPVGEIQVGLYKKDGGGHSGSFSIVWEDLDPEGDEPCVIVDIRVSPKSSWALTYFDDLFHALERMHSDMQTSEVCDLLIELGVKNMTPMQ